MNDIIVEASKYIIIILFALYTFQCFAVFRYSDEEKKAGISVFQSILMFLIHFCAYGAIYLQNETNKGDILVFYLEQVVFFWAVLLVYKIVFPLVSRLVVNNMVMLLSISFIMLARLDFALAKKQFMIAVVAMIVTTMIPLIIRKFKFFKNLTWVYGGIGFILLTAVFVLGHITYGAKLSVNLGGFSLQFSEFVKIIFVFFLASRFYESTEIRDLLVTSAVAAAHVLILVISKDLGAALIYFVVYLFMLYVATKKLTYFGIILASGAVAAFLAEKIFSHVQQRVAAWLDPWSDIADSGYQICQSLFAIGTGGWFGTGLCKGMPDTIPIVEEDFIFSAICEELGGIFGICLVLLCLSNFIMFLNISMQIRDRFYKLVALGLGTVYGFQIFLTIGGVTKFIPLTGVTLPLVSYGGSSLLSTLIIFAIIQGLYLMRRDEGEENERKESEKDSKDSDKKERNSEKAHSGKVRVRNSEHEKEKAIRRTHS
ncbi:FtsW/RodA/SpoVE family cell cycle protein [Acetitomaculum ruminis]|nr:FtsW/RodA/SpoVE family cell cycle protein [Acetitomaculum ruminis]